VIVEHLARIAQAADMEAGPIEMLIALR